MKKNEDRSDDGLDFCTPDETWQKPTVFAIMKPGQKRAVAAKGLTSKAKAEAWLNKSNKPDKDTYYIEKRPGLCTRCEQFCHVAPFCNQYRQYLSEKEVA